jgi:DNA-binding NarL/FixJ family response regulator
MDMRMPAMDGLEATRYLRAMDEIKEVVITAISASAFEHHREQYLGAGANDFLPKPFQQHKLLELMQDHLGLEFIYDEQLQDRAAKEGLCFPPQADMAALLDLVRRGDTKKILAEADRLEQADARYVPFIQEVRILAGSFKVKQLCQFLDTTQPSSEALSIESRTTTR